MTTNLAANPQDGSDLTSAANLSNEAADTAELQDENAEANQDPEGQTDEGDTEEVEHEGQKYRVPKPLKDAFLRNADYSRKTMEVSEQRKAVEAHKTAIAERETAFNREVETFKALQEDFTEVASLNKRVAEFEKVDWTALQQGNAGEAQTLWMAYQQTLIARGKAAGELQAKVTKAQQDRAAAASAATAKQKSELAASLVRDIPGYSPDVAGKMKDYAIREFGFTPQEVDGALDPRIHRLLHRAMIGDEAMKKAAKAAAASKTAEVATGLKPVPQVGSTARAATIRPDSPQGDKLATDEWMKRRNEQERKARAG